MLRRDNANQINQIKYNYFIPRESFNYPQQKYIPTVRLKTSEELVGMKKRTLTPVEQYTVEKVQT